MRKLSVFDAVTHIKTGDRCQQASKMQNSGHG